MFFESLALEYGELKKGTIHVHTENSPCGHYPTKDVCDLYFGEIMKYDFLSFTDHMTITKTTCDYKGKIIMPGIEFKRHDKQMLGVGITNIEDNPDDLYNHQMLIDKINANNGIAIICHPHLYRDDYWSCKELIALSGYSGIEIYNHNEKMNNSGRAVATDLWDKILLSGKKIYGYANDDMHHSSRVGGGYMMVLATDERSLISSLENGLFYSSSGLDAKFYGLKENVLRIIFNNKSKCSIKIRIIVDGVERLSSIIDNEDYKIPIDFNVKRYFRVEAMREDGAFVWFQPHFVK